MLSKPHRKFCEGIVSGLTGVRAYALAYPRCSLNTARINASQLRAKPHIQQEIARRRAQADTIAGPDVLILIEKRRWLARVVRANLAFLDPEIDGDLLVSLQVEKGRKQPRVSKMRIANKLAAIRLDSRLAGDEPAKSKSSTPTDAEKSPAGAGWRMVAPSGLVVPFEHCGWGPVRPTTPPEPSPDTPASEDPPDSTFPLGPELSRGGPRPSSFDLSASSDASADSPRSQTPIWERTCGRNSVSRGGFHAAPHANSESSTAAPDIPPEAPGAPPPTSHESPVTTPPSLPEQPPPLNFPPPRPRFDPGPDFAARQRARRRQPVVRHLWDEC
jgi:hypothetical protein